MFGVGFPELVIILLLALVVLGPERLPELARTLGKWFAAIKHAADEARFQVREEFEALEHDGDQPSLKPPPPPPSSSEPDA